MLVNLMLNDSLIYAIVIFGVIGILSKMVVSMTLNRLVKSASNMSKSKHKFMKLVKAKFEHASMANNGVDNVPIFVDKYIHEYKTLGMTLHSWQKLQRISLGIVVISGALGSVLAWYLGFGSTTVLQYATTGIGGTIILLSIYQVVDENHRIIGLRIYMVDYLANVLANRYEKSKEKNRIANPAQNTTHLPQMEKVLEEQNQKVNLQEIHKKNNVDNFNANSEFSKGNVDNFDTRIIPDLNIREEFQEEKELDFPNQENEKIVVTNTGFGWQAEAVTEASYTGVTAQDASDILENRIEAVRAIQSEGSLENLRKEIKVPKFHIPTLEEGSTEPHLSAMEQMLQDEAQKRTVAKEYAGTKTTVDSAMIREILEEFMA